MNDKELKEFRKKIVAGLELAYARMVEFKKYKNSPIIVSKDGKIIEIDPFEAEPTTKYEGSD